MPRSSSQYLKTSSNDCVVQHKLLHLDNCSVICVITFSSYLWFYFFFPKIYFIEVSLFYSVVLISAVQKSDSVIHVYIYCVYSVIHVYISVYICVYSVIHVYICVYICVYSVIHVYICVYIYVYIQLYMCIYVCIYIYTCIYTCVYIYVYILLKYSFPL